MMNSKLIEVKWRSQIENDTKGIMSTIDSNKKGAELAVSLFSEILRNGHSRLKHQLNSFVGSPLYYNLTKNYYFIVPTNLSLHVLDSSSFCVTPNYVDRIEIGEAGSAMMNNEEVPIMLEEEEGEEE